MWLVACGMKAIAGAPFVSTGRAVSNDVGYPDARSERINQAQSSFEGALTGYAGESIGMSTQEEHHRSKFPQWAGAG